MKSIAVFVTSQGRTAGLDDEGFVKCYSKVGNIWHVEQSIPFTLKDIKSVGEIRRSIGTMLGSLSDSRVFVAKEIAGQLYHLLEAGDFNSYEIDGVPEAFLNAVLREEEAEEARNAVLAANQDSNPYFPEKTTEDGCYSLNMKTLLMNRPELSTKKALLPFLKEVAFKRLEIVLDHLPPWFESELDKMGYAYVSSQVAMNECFVTIVPK